MTSFQRLKKLFFDRFYESEAAATGTGFEANVYAVLGIVAVGEIQFLGMGPLFLVAYAFGVTGFATVFQWDTLFPDRRDFLVLTPFPLRIRQLFGAKLAALGLYLSAIAVAVHAYIPFYFVKIASQPGDLWTSIQKLLAQIVATTAGALFGFLLIAAFQAISINVLGPRLYRRMSPWLQTAAMCVMIFAILLVPLYSRAVAYIPAGHAGWVWWIPPYWLWGIAGLLTGADPHTVALGRFGVAALAIGLLVFAAGWAAGYARYYRRSLEDEDVYSRRTARRRAWTARFLKSPEARAIYAFTGQTLARSAKHRMFLAGYLAAGISLGLFFTLTFQKGHIGVNPAGLRGLPPLITFFVVSGFRAAFQFPAELPSNWVFQLTEARWGDAARAAARLRVALGGLVPALLVLLPLEVYCWRLAAGVFHMVFQFAAGMLLIEVLFYSFDKIPFTCSYYPGGLNLIFLATAYLFGFTNYSFRIADLEGYLESRPTAAAMCLAAIALAVIATYVLRPRGSGEVRFDASQPEIQTLDLS